MALAWLQPSVQQMAEGFAASCNAFLRLAGEPAVTCRTGNSLPACKRSGGHLQGCWQLGQGGMRCSLEQQHEEDNEWWESKQLHQSWGCNFLQATHTDFPNHKKYQKWVEERKQKIASHSHPLFLILFLGQSHIIFISDLWFLKL